MHPRIRTAFSALMLLANVFHFTLQHSPAEAAAVRSNWPRNVRAAHCKRSQQRIGRAAVPPRRRILYNINHLKLVSNEVPLLLSLGYEIYIPKHLPSLLGEATSAGVTYEFDNTLTISEKHLALLDAHNFYDENKWGREVSEVINAHFCMVITAAYPTPVMGFLKHLTVPVGIRVFGHAIPTTYSDAFPPQVKETILKNTNRCLFLSAYSHLDEVEREFKDLFRFAPVTLKPEGPYFKRDVTHKSVLFQCSRVNENQYYTDKANKFLSDFGSSGLDFAIYGTDRSKFNDTRNLGRPSNDEIKRLFASYSAMYYDSVEPRHLHYHPLEAMYARMPVVFSKEGMLARLMPYSPAMSTDAEDARRKLQRLIQGDAHLEKEILWHQDVLLQTLKSSNNVEEWRAVLREFACGGKK